jgi:hypothetical protein
MPRLCHFVATPSELALAAVTSLVLSPDIKIKNKINTENKFNKAYEEGKVLLFLGELSLVSDALPSCAIRFEENKNLYTF